ncbi:hypothetical protein D5086_020103 [Populus alba]|uniref:Uncharacterized protein n=1 Tax=Populus alba TaxID=43335 RepID=A0ACC4BJH5_POPAL
MQMEQSTDQWRWDHGIACNHEGVVRRETYGGLMGDAFGNVGRRVLQLFVMLNNVKVLIVYMIIIDYHVNWVMQFQIVLHTSRGADVLSGTSSCGVHHAGALEETTGGMAVPFFFFSLPFPYFLHWHVSSIWANSLRYTSALAVALAVVFLVITAGITAVILVNGSANMPSGWEGLYYSKLHLVFASICYALEYGYKASDAWDRLCGFLLFGDSTLDDMLANFDTDLGVPYSSLLNDIVCISYALHLMLVFHVIFHPLRLNLGGLLFPSATPLVSDNDRFSLIITALISLIFLGANFIPNIWVAFQFTGATSAACLGFIFLAAIALRVLLSHTKPIDKRVQLPSPWDQMPEAQSTILR